MDAANRVVWTVVGAVLLLGGSAVAAAGLGALPRLDRDTALLPAAVVTRWRGWEPWVWWVVLGGGLLVAALGVVLARAELRRGGGPALDDLVDADLTTEPVAGPAAGRTRVRSGALVHGLTGDLGRHPRVRRVAVTLTGEAADLRVWARLDVKAGGELDGLYRHVAGGLRRFITTSGLRPGDVQVLVQIRDTGERVR